MPSVLMHMHVQYTIGVEYSRCSAVAQCCSCCYCAGLAKSNIAETAKRHGQLVGFAFYLFQVC